MKKVAPSLAVEFLTGHGTGTGGFEIDERGTGTDGFKMTKMALAPGTGG